MALDLSDRSLRQLACVCGSSATTGDVAHMKATLLHAAHELRTVATPSLHIQPPPVGVTDRLRASLDIPASPSSASSFSYVDEEPRISRAAVAWSAFFAITAIAVIALLVWSVMTGWRV